VKSPNKSASKKSPTKKGSSKKENSPTKHRRSPAKQF
jgi:hypothetical protein